MATAPLAIVVMGVCGSGKSVLGERLAQALGACFVEGDDFHPPANVERMAAGIALDDAARQGWLEALADELARVQAGGQRAVLACSALKRRYRDILRRGAPGLRLVHLAGSRNLLAQRMATRQGHYMPASLLESQLAALEAPGADERAVTLDAGASVESLLQSALAQLRPANP